MKKSKFVLPLFLAVMFLISCGDKPNTIGHDDDDGQGDGMVDEPKSIIDVQDAESLYSNYGEFRVPLIEEFQNVDEDGNPIPQDSEEYIQATRSLSLDYDELKTYLKFIEQQADSAKQDITGLRIYLGFYGEKGKYPNMETVFLNPLMEYGKKGDIRDDVSFAIQNINDKPTAVAVGEILGTWDQDKKGGANFTMLVQNPTQSLASNHFPPRPPPPPPSDPDYK